MIRIGELLVSQGILTEAEVSQALAAQRSRPEPFGAICERLFGVSPEAIEGAWAEQYARLTREWSPTLLEEDPSLREIVSARQAWQFRVVPIRSEAEGLLLATTTSHLPRALRFATRFLDRPAIFMLVEATRLAEMLMRRYPIGGLDAASVESPHLQSILNPLVRPAGPVAPPPKGQIIRGSPPPLRQGRIADSA